MINLEECCVLIPASTLEDFPSDLNDQEARGLLAAWTVLWHPVLIANAGQMPTWYRADAPPEPDLSPESHSTSSESSSDQGDKSESQGPGPSGQASDQASREADSTHPFAKKLIAVPTTSEDQLPVGYRDRAVAAGAVWLSGASRSEMVAAMDLEPIDEQIANQAAGGRTISVEDFYAAGFAALQIQVMTRRLRYTSNLDQLYVEQRMTEAAKAFLDCDTMAAIEGLHDVFDALAEERDHYFTSDPHVVELELVTPSTLMGAANSFADLPCDTVQLVDSGVDDVDQTASNQPAGFDDDVGVLPTPANVLLDADAIELIAKSDDQLIQSFRSKLASRGIAWAAGGPPASVQFELLDFAAAANALQESKLRANSCIGDGPVVYGRIDGSTPVDLIGEIASLGYRGVIPIDFAAGTGFTEEAKVILPIAGGEIEALTAKPIDANSDAAFLDIGAKMGESIDSGEIATALMVHWPGDVCDSFLDLKRVASWSVSLGRFWRLDDYFVKGERPFHQGHLSAASAQDGSPLTDAVLSGESDPITRVAGEFVASLRDQQTRMIAGIHGLVSGTQSPSDTRRSSDTRRDSGTDTELINGLAKSLGATPSDSGNAKCLINPLSAGTRMTTSLSSCLPQDHIYSHSEVPSSDDRNRVACRVDVPAGGFAFVRCRDGSSVSRSDASSKGKLTGWLCSRLVGKPAGIAEGLRLHNEFMEVTISERSGGISGVFSGSVRGNRFSMRLVAEGLVTGGSGDSVEMVATQHKVTLATSMKGQIEVTGVLRDGDEVLADFTAEYSLESGSRIVGVNISISPKRDCFGENAESASTEASRQNPWKHYIAARVAVSEESSVCRALVRDKVHRVSHRRIVSPLGLLIDESERQTLISSDGLPFHRVVGERFFDTLLAVRGETNTQHRLRYGFDVPQPIVSALSLLSGPIDVPVDVGASTPSTGWLVHLAPSDVVMNDISTHQLSDGRMVGHIRLLQTRARSVSAKLQLCREVAAAYCLSGPLGEVIKRIEESDESLDSDKLKTNDGVIKVSVPGHSAVSLLVVFSPN